MGCTSGRRQLVFNKRKASVLMGSDLENTVDQVTWQAIQHKRERGSLNFQWHYNLVCIET